MPRKKKKPKTVLITGVNNLWGRRLAARLCTRPNLHVIGMDNAPPPKKIAGLDFVQADIRNPLLLEFLELEGVDIVYHLAFIESYSRSEPAFDHNVIGTMKLMGACAHAGVRKVIFKSSTRVYGATPRNPAFLREEHPLRGTRRYGYNRDLVEIELFFNGFQRQYPHMVVSILRFPNIIETQGHTPFTRFLSDPAAPVLFGFDPIMQVIHAEDVVSALEHALESDYRGAYNVAAEGLLPLLKILGIVGKVPLPMPHLLPYWGLGVGAPLARHMPLEPEYLRYRWVADLQRMREVLQYTPKYTAEEAVREFAGMRRARRYKPQARPGACDEERLRETIERRRQQRNASKSRTPQGV